MSRAYEDSRGDGMDRRRFLQGTVRFGAALGGASLLAGCGNAAKPARRPDDRQAGVTASAARLPDSRDPDDFIIHSRRPLNIELRRDRFGTDLITPPTETFIRSHLPLPSPESVADRDAWQVEIQGVRRPGKLMVSELKQLGVTTVACVLECSGNGRSWFKHRPSGVPWQVGAAANLLWTGVPLAKVIEALGGPVAKARFVTATGGERLPPGVAPKTVMVERSIPIEKVLADGLLAWDMNSEPLPLSNGGPLRLVVPGYFGVNHIKFVCRIALTDAESDAAIQAIDYRMSPVGVQVPPVTRRLGRCRRSPGSRCRSAMYP